jgi:hypothetical protein
MELEMGKIVKGNARSGLVKGDIGVVVAVDLNPPRNIKVKFVNRGYWLICPHELCEPLEHDNAIISDKFINDALKNTTVKPSRTELIELLGEALNHIDDNDLNKRINDAIEKHSG